MVPEKQNSQALIGFKVMKYHRRFSSLERFAINSEDHVSFCQSGLRRRASGPHSEHDRKGGNSGACLSLK
jgi:hypothetical protein